MDYEDYDSIVKDKDLKKLFDISNNFTPLKDDIFK